MNEREFINQIKSLPGNNYCVDCNDPNPSWASIPFGILLCLQCSGKHRGLGVHISIVRSLTLDSWDFDKSSNGGDSNNKINFMLKGGNSAFASFLEQHASDDINKNIKSDIRLKYTCPHAQLYKAILQARVNGKPEPSMSDITIQNYTDPKDTNKKNTQHGYNTSQNSTTLPTSSQLFPILFHYWFDRHYSSLRNLISITLASKLFISTFISKSEIDVETPSILDYTPTIFMGLSIIKFTHILLLSYRSISWWRKYRMDAFKSAINALDHRINKGRAKRNSGYDLYFPSSTGNKNSTTLIQNEEDDDDDCIIGATFSKAIILFPDLLVDSRAYSIISSIISDSGSILTIVVNLEPTRTPTVEMGMETILKIRHEVEKLLGITILEWLIGGHGLGAQVALDLVNSSSHISRGVLWGYEENRNCFEHVIHPEKSVLIINGSNDGTISKIPKSTFHHGVKNDQTLGFHKYCSIEGGNHAAFAHYGPHIFPVKDGDRTISLEKQQELCVTLILEFINSTDSSPARAVVS